MSSNVKSALVIIIYLDISNNNTATANSDSF